MVVHVKWIVNNLFWYIWWFEFLTCTMWSSLKVETCLSQKKNYLKISKLSQQSCHSEFETLLVRNVVCRRKSEKSKICKLILSVTGYTAIQFCGTSLNIPCFCAFITPMKYTVLDSFIQTFNRSIYGNSPQTLFHFKDNSKQINDLICFKLF